MDIRRIDELARTSPDTNERLTIYERYYYVAIRGLYSQCKAREITPEQLEHDKEVIVDVHEEYIGRRTYGSP